jgi:5-methylcytosine-specific restriction protein A
MTLQRLRSGLQGLPQKVHTLVARDNDTRLRGRGLQERNRALTERDPMCVHCRREGIVGRAQVWDHEVPLWQGGVDDESNLQGLCITHHATKTAREATERAALARKPR